jgi:nucleoside-diphosphate-sugar epimerase
MKIFLTGATGVVGRRLVPTLLARGHQVAAMARSPANAEAIARLGGEPVRVELFGEIALSRAMTGCDAAINLATHIPDSSLAALRPGAWAENDRIRKLGSETLARAATAAGVGVLIQESFAPVYPDRGAAWIDETAPLQPARYNRTVADAERAAHGFSARGGRGIVLRFGAFYGPDAWQVAELIRFIRKGWVPLPARPESFISPVSHDDAASAVAAALAAEAGTYNVVDDRPLPRREFYDLLAAELDVPPPKLPPFWLAPAMGSLVRLLGRSQRISNRKLREATGWAPLYPSVREGWPATLREMGELPRHAA